MTVTRHTNSPSEGSTSEEITGSTYRFRYNSVKGRFEAQRKIAGEWFTDWGNPAFIFEENFPGFYISGANLIAQNTMYTTTVGGGGGTILQEPTGGIRLATGGGGGSSTTIASGSGAAYNFYKSSKEIFASFEQRIPTALNLLNTDWFLGFFFDANNYLGWNYIADAAIDQWFLITRSGGVETKTKVGETPGITPITLRLHITTELVRGWYNDTIVIDHITNIPDLTMQLVLNVGNRVAAIKQADIMHISILNDL